MILKNKILNNYYFYVAFILKRELNKKFNWKSFYLRIIIYKRTKFKLWIIKRIIIESNY